MESCLDHLTETGSGTHVLGGDGETRLLRVTRPGQAFPILARMADRDGPADAVFDRLRREHALSRRLDPAWAVKPLDLLRHGATPVLTLADPGGQPLAMLELPTPSVSAAPLRQRLVLAARIAGAVAQLHRRRLLHGDLRPFNLLVAEDGTVRLTGFGRASDLSEPQRQEVERPAALLPYMAPEQTGRMNRPVDRRSDLYALGVTLYELFTGELPFAARDPIEWVHSHLARAPAPPTLHAPDLPPAIADILLRLLAKSAEDRYQTADGLLRDLTQALQLLETQGRIPSFPAGRRDLPEGLDPPPFLYGRDEPVAILQSAFEQVAGRGRMGIVLISGRSGVGKSAVVHALEEQLVPPRGLFAAGKFDQGKRDLPYASLAEAFRGLVARILALPVPHRDQWRREVAEAVGDGGVLMAALIPNLGLLIGEQPAVAPLPPQEAQNRFDLLFRRVLQLFARPDHPLVLFLDDLQWLDRATLDLLDRLVADGGIGHLLLVGAYRGDEIGADHPLTVLMRRIGNSASELAGAGMEAREIDCREIALGPLTSDELRRMVADSLDRKPDEVATLAALLEERTGGNAFFAVQLLTALERSGSLWFDRGAKRWDWNPAAAATAWSGVGIATLMTERLGRFPARARDLLARLAALGASAPLSTLALAAGLTEAETERDLEPVLAEGLLLRTDDGLRFLHDRVQEGAYALVPVEGRGTLHLGVARALQRGFAADLSGERLFALVGQYDRCLSLIQDGHDREEVATLHLAAGHRAKAASAHGAALAYAQAGLRLLEGSQWERRHRLTFALEHLQAECEFLSGDLQRAELRLVALVGRAGCPVDRAAITALLVTVYTAIDRSDRAIEACLAYLRGAGIDWPAHPPAALAQEEYARLRAAIGDRPVASLAALSAVGDPDSRATLDVLAAALPPAFFSDRNLVCLILCRMANLTLLHGRSDASALGFAYLGMMAGPFFGDYAAGYAFGRLGYDMAERQGRTRYRARVLMTFAYHVVPWTRDIRSERPLLLRAFEEAREAGDVTYGGFTSVTLVTSMLAAGDPLATVQRTAEARLAYVRQVKFGLCADILTTQIQVLRALRGRTDALASFDGQGFDNAAFEARLLANPSLDIATCWHWIRTLQLRCIAGEMAAAVEAAERAEGLLWTTSGHWEMAEFHFHAALARAGAMDAAMDGAKPEDRDRHAAALARHIDQLREWASHSSDSFDARFALAEAEAARTQGRTEDAMRGYDRAVLAARRTALPHVEALAHECAAGLYRRMGVATLELACIRNAAERYAGWGATAKLRQLARRYPFLALEAAEPAAPEAPRGFDGVDLASLLETLRTVSDQAGVEQLTTTLLTLVLEHAGASRGLLILARGEGLRVEAEATTGLYGVSVRLVQEDAERFALPHAIIHGAIRDQEAVIVDDARADGPLSADPYFRGTEARSILCLPLVRRRRVVGLLHLENALATYAFTPQRVDVLTLLGAQAAASLETATLEEKDALLREIHHRVKNNLQLVTSLLNLQSRRIKDAAVAALFADSRDRVRSMALVHESLYRLGNFARVPMREHLEAVCAHLLRAYSRQAGAVRLETELADLKLDINRAVPCGLIVNELVSNALKHAHPGGRGGLLRVVLTADGQECRLSVRDDGVGLPGGSVPDNMDSVGLQLVSDLTNQLHGSLEYSYNRGAEFIVAFPLKGNNRGLQ